MIIRATQKLAQKLKIESLQEYDKKVSAFEEWYGHLFSVNRIQYILFTNAYSLYSTIVPGRGTNNLRTFLDLTGYWLSEVLKEEGCENMIGRLFTNNTEIIDVCKTTNRGVLGSMNDMVAQSKFYFSEYQLAPIEISKRLNETPYSYLKYNNPLSVIKQMSLS